MFKTKYIAVLLSALLLASCVSKASILKISGSNTLSILKTDIKLHGKSARNYSDECLYTLEDSSGKKVKYWEDKKTGYVIINSAPGRVSIKQITCNTTFYRLIFYKRRDYTFEDLNFTAYPNQINYAGDLDINWNPKRFKIEDVYYLKLGNTDEGKFKMELTDNTDNAKKYIQNSKELTGLKFNKSLLSGSNLQ